jgi:hypothetical protein
MGGALEELPRRSVRVLVEQASEDIGWGSRQLE